MNSPTMKDVAREAGVALKTVSRYVNGETNINPELAERIGRAIASLGYRRNLAAASIRPGWTSRTIGLVIGDLANPYYSPISRAVEQVAREAGYALTIASSDESGERHDQIIDRMLQQRIDGVIVVPPQVPGRPWARVAPPVPPVVFIDRPPDLDPAYVVLADNAGGARQATLALIEAGSRRIAFVSDSLELHTMRERHQGYTAALADSGLAVDPALVFSGAHDSDQAARITAEILRASSADAIFAGNNRAALGALRAFALASRRLPIVGFDDFEAAELLRPGLSVVTHDTALMGAQAATILLSLIRGEQPAAGRRVLPTALTLRGSERPGSDAG